MEWIKAQLCAKCCDRGYGWISVVLVVDQRLAKIEQPKYSIQFIPGLLKVRPLRVVSSSASNEMFEHKVAKMSLGLDHPIVLWSWEFCQSLLCLRGERSCKHVCVHLVND